jgi:nucleotide-binding universal stress UspA family protein
VRALRRYATFAVGTHNASDLGMIERILIPVDFSDTAAAAAEYGCELAARLGARVTLLHVLSSGIISTPDAVFAPTPEEQLAMSRAARAHLRSIAEKLDHDGLVIDCLAVEGVAAGTIREIAGREHADLIVMGTHGRRGVSQLLLGSVPEYLIRHAPCPVLTIGRACLAATSHAHAFG